MLPTGPALLKGTHACIMHLHWAPFASEPCALHFKIPCANMLTGHACSPLFTGGACPHELACPLFRPADEVRTCSPFSCTY
eukprot:1159839-Pelagomonas_calceolata.AAC.11